MADQVGTKPAVDGDRIVADLRALIRIPSITGSEEAVADWAADALREIGMRVEVVRPSLEAHRTDAAWPGEEMDRTSLPVVIGRAGSTGTPRIILSGHLDVVPPGDPPPGRPIRGAPTFARARCTAVAPAT